MTSGAAWDAERYLRFASERTRPSHELLARVDVDAPTRVVDLGCGPGNSTAVLRARWPDADVLGVDHSEEMIAAARARHPDGRWQLADLATFSSERPFDVVFSNAALHWLPDHAALVARLFELVAPGGALAFQVPRGHDAPVRRHARELADDARWHERLEPALTAVTMDDPAVYYDALAPVARRVDVWTTEYGHVVDDAEAIIEWATSTALRPYLAPLDDAERRAFLDRLVARVGESYPPRADGRVLFPFARLFVVASH